jgi:hypothetical protein
MIKLTRILALAGYFIFASIPLNAVAAYVLDFGTGLAGAGGTITNAGGSISGSNIFIGSLIVDGTTTSNGTYVVDALLNFDTSANTISIVGNIATLGITGETLLSGSFTSYSTTVIPQLGGGQTEVFQATGPDTKSNILLGILGIPLDTQFDFFGFSIESANGSVVSTDIVNTAAVVPVPAAVWLFGSGLLGLVGIARRKQAA